MSSCPEAEKLALDFLKGKENPFDSLARPQRLDDRFLDLHVPELLADDRRLLLQVIDHYRVEEYTRTADLRPTRVVTILGDRGEGKTHLLQSLAYRADGQSQLLVRPSYFDYHLPFEEYLVSQLMATLAAEDEVYRSRPIEDIAAALTRRLLRQTLRGLGPTERLFALSPSRWKCCGLLLGGADREIQVLDRLVASVETANAEPSLAHLVEHHGLDPRQCLRLIRGHLHRHEAGPDLLAVLRRGPLRACMAHRPRCWVRTRHCSDCWKGNTTRSARLRLPGSRSLRACCTWLPRYALSFASRSYSHSTISSVCSVRRTSSMASWSGPSSIAWPRQWTAPRACWSWYSPKRACSNAPPRSWMNSPGIVWSRGCLSSGVDRPGSSA